jgi:UDP-N-acetylglucosamine 2-epimerase (non-hydrolysing)
VRIIIIAGARPNFMKIAPIIRAIDKYNDTSGSEPIEYVLVHTGQHYDFEMSKVFFEDLKLPEPDIHLGVGSGTHAQQTARVMLRLEKTLINQKTGLVLVVGDVNSTLAGALVAVKMHIPIAHVEAGLRSHERDIPEEINRVLTDAVSNYLYTPSPDASENLKREGTPEEKIFLVGNVMVDSLLANKAKAERSRILLHLDLSKQQYALLTLHRPSNVDDRQSLTRIISALREVSKRIPIVFPAHPRTKKNMEKFGLTDLIKDERILFIEPLGYLDFLKLMMNAKLVMTDSGGIQEETTVLGIPCLTLRNTTERPVTVTQGTNKLVWNDTEKIISETFKILDGKGKQGVIPHLWDGKAAERIVNSLAKKVKRHAYIDATEEISS